MADAGRRRKSFRGATSPGFAAAPRAGAAIDPAAPLQPLQASQDARRPGLVALYSRASRRASLLLPMAGDRLTPVRVKAPHGARELEIEWADGRSFAYPHRILRGYCPCAGCQGHAGTIRFIAGGNLELVGLEQVGNYALSLSWGDQHTSGIYSYRFLRSLGELLTEHGPQGLEALGELPRA